MALAGYGEPVFLEQLARRCTMAPGGAFRFSDLGEHPDLFRQVPRIVEWMSRLTGTPRADDQPAKAHRDMAASVQAFTEDVIANCVGATIARTGVRDVCLAGGVALNGLANQRLLDRGVVDTLLVPPWTDDRGLAVGAAALAVHSHGIPLEPIEGAVAPFLGPEPEPWTGFDAEFGREVRGDDAFAELVQRIIRGEVVGWFEGRDEAGPRALGHRSVLATPTKESVRARLNGSIKRREPWRPFGCSISRERVCEWFELDDDSPFMLRIVRAREHCRARIPAALHVDGTSRLHTVTHRSSPRLARLLEALRLAGHPPLLVNTSMNGRGAPLVHRASEAFTFARESSLDALVLDDVLYTRGTP
jgi:carbamoyltransferase